MSVTDYKAYQKIITDSYDERSASYAKSEWHRALAERLVDYFPPRAGDTVLDIATGTGNVAFHAAKQVGEDGRVIGVDISKGMIAEAERIRLASQSANIEFTLADGEQLDYPDNSFDRIYCASAFFWVADKPRALANWYRLLKPGGILGFHATPETSFVYGYVARNVLKTYGVEYLAHSPTGSKEICESLMKKAGYTEIQVNDVKEGHFITLQEARDAWITEEHYPVGQYPHPVAVTQQAILDKAQRDYDAEMARRLTDKGIWNDTTMYYVYGTKGLR